ncbi:MAG: ABC transporter permease [Lentisphaeraceae bacterium]|nr:ABC transporter permease [Lentisphaeraceae bacterium]
MNKNLKNKLNLLLPFIGLIFVVIVVTVFILVKDSSKINDFYSLFNLKLILRQTVVVGIGALGMTLVIISGGIDLSVGSVVALGSVVCAMVMTAMATGPVGPDGALILSEASVSMGGMIVALLASVVVCSLCGLMNGAITAKFKMMPFIVTLGTMQIARGIAKIAGNDERVRTPDNGFQSFMDQFPDPQWLFFAPGVWVMIGLTIIVGLMLKFTVMGRYIYAIGSNEDTARLCGINVEKYKILIYTLCGVLTGIAACMDYSNLGSGNPVGNIGLELNIIAAVVIGGASLNGGEGSALGSLIGALIMAILVNAFTKLSIPQAYQEITIGVIIILAVGIDKLKHRKAA